MPNPFATEDSGSGNGNTEAQTEAPNDNVTVRRREAIEFENFNNGLVSMDIPKGWEVSVVPNVDYPFYTFMAYNPEDNDYRIFVNLKFEGYLKSQEAKDFYINNYGADYVFSTMPILAELTAEYYYKNVFNETGRMNSSAEFAFPNLNDFTVIQNFGPTDYGGDLLRASYVNDEGEKIEGMFTASPKDIGEYYVNINPADFTSPMVDAWYRNVYDTMFITAPEAEFVNWEEALTHCLNSIEFSDAFIEGFNRSQDALMQQIRANQKIYDQISDMIMDSWYAREYAYDIQVQKYCDAILGYERVYDTETGETFQADIGFMDSYSGTQYAPITDDMYALPCSGYIE